MHFSRLELPGESPVGLNPGLNVLGGLDAAARRRWLDALSGKTGARVWLGDSDAPATDLGLSPADVEAMVVRREEFTSALSPHVASAGPTSAPRPTGPDPSPVAAALAAWREAFVLAGGHAEEVAGLAAEWERLSAALAAEPVLARDDQEKIEAARQNLDRALEAVTRARQACCAAGLDPDTVAIAHRLHDEVMAAQEQASRRFAGSKTRARLTAALEEESQFLATLGVSSYTAFLLEVLDRPADPELARRVQEAEKEAQEAEATWRALGTLGVQARERAHLEHQLEVVRRRVGDLLGGEPDGDVATLLRTWPARVPDVEATRLALQAALAGVGVDPGSDPASTAADWLAACSERSDGEHEVPSHHRHEEASEPSPGPSTDPDQIERYLLDRVAAQTRESEAFPLVFDDALEGLPEPVLDRALAVIQQAATSLQIIYLTADSDDQPVDLTDLPAGSSIGAPTVEQVAGPDTVDPERVVAGPPMAESPVAGAPALTSARTAALTEAPESAVAPVRGAAGEKGSSPGGAPKLAWCKPGSHHTAVDACSRCGQSVCDDHLVRTRTTFPSLCPSCALEVAGVARGRRRR